MAVHTTEQEIKFIQKLGRFSIQGQEGAITRPELLRRYIKASGKRTDWDAIDKRKALGAAKEELWAAAV